MQLKEILTPDCVKVPLAAGDKHQAITELVELLHHNGLLEDYQTALKAVMDRESVRSTGIGRGFAIPHGRCPAIDRLIMAAGKPAQPIDFQSIDSRPVSIILLLVSPPDQTGPHIQALARISRIITDHDLRQKLFACSSPKQLYQHLANSPTPQRPPQP